MSMRYFLALYVSTRRPFGKGPYTLGSFGRLRCGIATFGRRGICTFGMCTCGSFGSFADIPASLRNRFDRSRCPAFARLFASLRLVCLLKSILHLLLIDAFQHLG